MPWEENTWLEEVTAWVTDQLESPPQGIELMHKYSWSAMAKVRTRQGMKYFKATSPAMRYEAALTYELAQWRPDVTVELLGHDTNLGWLLMDDSGPTLRALNKQGKDTERMLNVFRTYAKVQIDTATQVDKYRRLGLPDRTVDSVVAGGQRLGVSTDLLTALANDVRRVVLPTTLVHEEVHDANVLVRGGIPVFIDWSDSSVGHPFFGVVVALRSVSDQWDLEPGDFFLEQLLDAYLEPWTYLASTTELREIFPSAYRLGMLNRALSWEVGIDDLPAAEAAQGREYVAAWLAEFHAASDPKPGT